MRIAKLLEGKKITDIKTAERMREAAANAVEQVPNGAHPNDYADAIRAIPISEDADLIAAEAEVARLRSGGAGAIAAERQRQIEEEGWTPALDDCWEDDQLACAAICYLRHSPALCAPEAPSDWPWAADWWKPKDRRRDLVRAGALIAAEIDRLDRAERKRK